MQNIAIAVRDVDLFLLATINRTATTDVYVNWPRKHVTGWEPHASFHASGQHHQKSFGKASLIQKKQKPDSTFKGTENLVSFGVGSLEHLVVNVLCNPKDFSAVFEIPHSTVGLERFRNRYWTTSSDARLILRALRDFVQKYLGEV